MFQGIYDSGTKYGNIAEQLGIPNANGEWRGARVDHDEHHGNDRVWATAPAVCRRSTITGKSTRRSVGSADRHELKFGFDYMSRRFAFHSPGAPNGQFTFSGIYSEFRTCRFPVWKPDQFALGCHQVFQPASLLFQLVRAGQLAGQLEAVHQHGSAQRFDHRMEGAPQPAGGLRS